jgi:threonine dehydrogenase-like Zn-dependent dehydrogenase
VAVTSTLVEQLVHLLRTCRSGPIEVIGDDNLAESLGRCLPERVVRASTTSPAAVVIDASGSPERIGEALRRLDNLGTLVLACGVVGGIITNLYTDLHLRGLTIVAVPSQRDPS